MADTPTSNRVEPTLGTSPYAPSVEELRAAVESVPAGSARRGGSAGSAPMLGERLDQLSRIEDKTARIEEKYARTETGMLRVQDKVEAAMARMTDAALQSDLVVVRERVEELGRRVPQPPGPELALAHGDRDRAPHRRLRARGAEIPAGAPARMSVRTLDDADLKGKRVLVRVDLNVPMENGRVADATRIERVIPTIQEIADKGGKVVLLAHFGRPKGRDPKQSLKPIAAALSDVLGRPVAFAEDCIGEAAAKAVAAMKEGDILLLENTRFHAGEEKNDRGFAKALATLGDVYVNDAFSAAHRAHASTEGLAHVLPAYAGRAMQAELEALAKGLEAPARPLVAIVGGAKVSTKIDLLENLVAKVDALVIGGGMANTFLQAIDIGVGRSLAERDLARRRGGSWTRRARPTAPSSCRSTPSSPASSRRTRRTTPTASTRSRPTA